MLLITINHRMHNELGIFCSLLILFGDIFFYDRSKKVIDSYQEQEKSHLARVQVCRNRVNLRMYLKKMLAWRVSRDFG